MMADDAAQAQFQQLASYLRDIGLDDLFQVDSAGNPSGWLWNQIQAGVDTAEELRFALEQTDTFRDRFGVIQEQQARAARGEPVRVMSPAEVIEYEQRAKEIMRAAGLPGTFFDEPSDFHSLILNDMSITEVQQRVTEAFDYVLAAPPEVRQMFDQFYGVGAGDAQLAAWALDPDRTVRDINRATRTAYAAGMGERFDVTLDKAAAERIADLPMTEAGITEGIKSVAELGTVFTEGLGERGLDLTQQAGLDAVFEGSAEASGMINRRITQRRAVGRSASGGAVTTQEGVVGLGSS